MLTSSAFRPGVLAFYAPGASALSWAASAIKALPFVGSGCYDTGLHPASDGSDTLFSGLRAQQMQLQLGDKPRRRFMLLKGTQS